jgi:hypothetical protein
MRVYAAMISAVSQCSDSEMSSAMPANLASSRAFCMPRMTNSKWA